jgi:ABC-type lipoprotein export system ATPase subunit
MPLDMLRRMLFKRSSAATLSDVPQADPNAPLISMRGVEKSFPQGGGQTFVLRRIALDIKPGEFVSIMGPSGAGKSTLLHIMGMHDHAWSGEYQLLGQPIHHLAAKERAAIQKRTIGFVFQAYHLLDDLTVYENIELPLSYRDVRRSERQSIVADVLDRFGMVAKKDLYPNQLSGGQQQLVGVARAIVANPAVILADEPTGNLHSSQAQEIMELFKRLNEQGTTIVQVTHSETNASYGSRIIRLRDGYIQES